MVSYYTRIRNKNIVGSTKLITNRWSIPKKVNTGKRWPREPDNDLLIPPLKDIQLEMRFFRIRPPFGDADPRLILYSQKIFHKYNLLDVALENQRCATNFILNDIEQLLESDNDLESIELTTNQLSFLSDLLNIQSNNRTSIFFIRDPSC